MELLAKLCYTTPKIPQFSIQDHVQPPLGSHIQITIRALALGPKVKSHYIILQNIIITFPGIAGMA